MNGWDRLSAELDRWGEAGRRARFWWRDDDAVAPTPALEALLTVAGETGTPVALAVVPEPAVSELGTRLAQEQGVTVLQHGYAHRNHAPAQEKKMELGPHRRADHVIAELGMGRERLERLFGDRFLAVMVPPWNRISPRLVPMLPEMHYTGLSTFAPRERAEPVGGFRQVNTHVDVIDWKGGRGFVGDAAAIAAAVAHLSARREGAADPDEPTGILTHHLVQEADSWRFLAALFGTLHDHPAGTVLDAPGLFGETP